MLLLLRSGRLPITRIHRPVHAFGCVRNYLKIRNMASEASTMKREPEVNESGAQDTSLKRAKLESADTEMTVQGAQTDDTEQTTQRGKAKGKGKGKGKEKVWESRRRRGTRVEGGEPTAAGGNGNTEDKAPRLPKRQCALLIGFCGSGYNGMQIQPDVRTIEGTLFSALVGAGAVSKDNADDPVKVNLQRAARTDAGVHAAGNVVSLKLITTVPGVPDLTARINELLPPEIRLWKIQRVQNSFNARLSCDSRKYTYYFPSYMLIPPRSGSGLERTFRETSEAIERGLVRRDEVEEGGGVEGHGALGEAQRPSADAPVVDTSEGNSATAAVGSASNISPSNVSTAITTDLSTTNPEKQANETKTSSESGHPSDFDLTADMAERRRYRVTEEQMTALREAAVRFEGSHNFHNYTVGRDSKDRSCWRYMKKIEVGEPVVHGETEWISVKLHGQSFMLHQRKMMCVLVIAVRTGTPSHIINALYAPTSVNVPKMPALGLLLEHPIFESYNRRAEQLNTQQRLATTPEDPGFRAPIEFGEEGLPEMMERFKEEWIYKGMREAEERVHVFAQWLAVLDKYAGADLTYFNSAGIIPDSAILPARTYSSNTKNANAKMKKPDARSTAAESGGADPAGSSGQMKTGGNDAENGSKIGNEGEGGVEVEVGGEKSTSILPRRANPFRERRRFDATDFRVGGVGEAAFANVALESVLAGDVSEEEAEGEEADVEMRED